MNANLRVFALAAGALLAAPMGEATTLNFDPDNSDHVLQDAAYPDVLKTVPPTATTEHMLVRDMLALYGILFDKALSTTGTQLGNDLKSFLFTPEPSAPIGSIAPQAVWY